LDRFGFYHHPTLRGGQNGGGDDVGTVFVQARKAGAVTIYNERYLRYSGELQIVLQDTSKDDRVNVVAYLQNLSDMKKLAYFREGYTYELIEADEHLPFLTQSML
jgi:hypothetical protein